ITRRIAGGMEHAFPSPIASRSTVSLGLFGPNLSQSISPRRLSPSGLLHAVACKLPLDGSLDGLCRRDVDLTGFVAVLKLRKSASIERTCQLRIKSQRRTIIVDG